MSDALSRLLSSQQQRLRTLENRYKVVVGSWVLEEGPGGNLQARHAPTGAIHTLAVAPPPLNGGVNYPDSDVEGGES